MPVSLHLNRFWDKDDRLGVEALGRFRGLNPRRWHLQEPAIVGQDGHVRQVAACSAADQLHAEIQIPAKGVVRSHLCQSAPKQILVDSFPHDLLALLVLALGQGTNSQAGPPELLWLLQSPGVEGSAKGRQHVCDGADMYLCNTQNLVLSALDNSIDEQLRWSAVTMNIAGTGTMPLWQSTYVCVYPWKSDRQNTQLRLIDRCNLLGHA